MDISNTSKYFIIQNNFIYKYHGRIIIEDIFQSTCNITNTVIRRSIGSGIRVYNSSELFLSNNTIELLGQRGTGIYLDSSPFCTLDNNSCSTGWSGIYICSFSSNWISFLFSKKIPLC
ncbi:MAG: right-handed parallel beta-helix repeat-containing protein [Asgard group archaeon]|nr:right-handed parallel beta-helix repeat-containing protein [Asgard group archaeon]